MRLPFGGQDEDPSIGGASPAEVLDELCDRHGFLLLATPFLSFPAHALDREGEEIRLRVRLTQDFVKRTLGTQPLRIRFPWGLGMVGGPVKILGYVQEEGRRVLRIRVPAQLVDEDRREAVRLEPPGQGGAMLSPDGESLVKGRVEDVSVLGARVFALEPLNTDFGENRSLQLSLNLEPGPRLNVQARVVHQDGQTLGLAFQPPLESSARLELEAFLLPEIEALQRRWENRAALRAAAEARVKPKIPPEGILLLGRDKDLESDLLAVLPESLPLRLCTPILGPLRDALEKPPKLVLLHVVKGGIEERFMLKALAEALPPATPVVVLGSPAVSGGRELAAELKAANYVEWNPAQALFFSRLLQGLVRKRWGSPEE